MAPERRLARLLRALPLVVLATLAAAPAAHALRIVNYNILNYPSVNLSGRQPHFRAVLAPLNADIVVVQEIQSQAGVDSFRTNVLNVIEPGQWASAPFFNGPDTDNAFFYKTTTVQHLGSWAWVPPDNLRNVSVSRFKPLGYNSAAAELRVYSLHLKAGSSGTDAARRLTDAIGIRDSMNAMPAGTHAILTGDFNIYSGAEAAFAKFLESQTNNIGRLYDPLNAPLITWNTASLAAIHTQCPCLTCPSGSYAGGGLDDRFDMFLPTYNLNDGEGLDLLVSTYIPVGNDGLHYNGNITDPPTIPEGAAYANSLWMASDHLPVRVDVQVPPKVSVVAALPFGTVIVGATATQNLAVSNVAPLPADELDYSLAAAPGFTAPGGSFAVNAGAPANHHTIGMTTGSPGNPAGLLTVTSDDPDTPAASVALSGTVLGHAQASLDSTSALLGQSLDFGTHASGGFSTLMARVHNRGYHALQARLSVTSGNITGGDGRFSIVGGFTPALVSGVARTYTIQFDDTGATPDVDYDATLTFASADESLPGATAQPALTVSLHAKVASGAVGVPGGPALPTATLLHAPAPNPLAERTVVGFDLAREADLRLGIYDLAGRRVATLAEGAFPAGQFRYGWDGRAENGAPLGSGLFFVRLDIAGEPARVARLAVVR